MIGKTAAVAAATVAFSLVSNVVDKKLVAV